MHTVRLETESGHFVIAGRIPPYLTLPTILVWGERFFHLYEAGSGGRPHRYRERFTVVLIEIDENDPIPQLEPKEDKG